MLALAKTTKRYPWFHPLIFLLSHTGVRIGKAINLKWANIDTKRGMIHIRDETYKKKEAGKERRALKGKKSRIIPIHPSLFQFISNYERTSDYFSVGKEGRKRSDSHTRDQFVKHIIEPLMSEFPTPKGALGVCKRPVPFIPAFLCQRVFCRRHPRVRY